MAADDGSDTTPVRGAGPGHRRVRTDRPDHGLLWRVMAGRPQISKGGPAGRQWQQRVRFRWQRQRRGHRGLHAARVTPRTGPFADSDHSFCCSCGAPDGSPLQRAALPATAGRVQTAAHAPSRAVPERRQAEGRRVCGAAAGAA